MMLLLRNVLQIGIVLLFLVSSAAGQPTKNLRSSTTAHFIMYRDKNVSAKTLELVGKDLQRAYQLFERRLGFAPGSRFPAYLYSSKERMRGDSRYAIFDDAYYADGKIVIMTGPLMERQAAMASTIDRVVGNAFAHTVATCPPWFAEVYALAAGEDYGRFDLPTRSTLSSFSDLGEDLSRADRGPEMKSVYASLSATAKYFADQFGPAKLDAALVSIRKGKEFDEALPEATGVKFDDLERSWSEYLRGLVRR